jgi:hypothetical protein
VNAGEPFMRPKPAAGCQDEVERILSEKDAEPAKLTSALDERSALLDAPKAEIVALAIGGAFCRSR